MLMPLGSEQTDTVVPIVRSAVARSGSVGIAEKFIGRRISDNRQGVIKFSSTLNFYDNLNELVCHKLGILLGVDTCETSLEFVRNSDVVMSLFSYNPEHGEQLRSAYQLFGGDDFNAIFTLDSLVQLGGEAALTSFNKMVLFDLLTRQVDRHIGNFGFVNEKFYPLYDNGRCLYYDSVALTELSAVDTLDVTQTFVTNEHGYGWPYVMSFLTTQDCRNLLNVVEYSDIRAIVGYYYDAHRAELLSRYIWRVYTLLTGREYDA